MQLLVDIGNTNIKWAQFVTELGSHKSIGYKNQDIQKLLNQQWGKLEKPAVVYVANVGSSDIGVELSRWVGEKWSCPLHFIKSTASAAGVTNGYDFPEQLGVDRWLAVIAAYNIFKTDVCVFDCGTAITLDLVNAKGLYQGGLIFPGISLLQTSLVVNAAGCIATQSGNLNFNNHIVATNTNDGILLGSINAALSIIQYQRIRLTEEFHLNPTFVITGGDAPLLLLSLPSAYHYLPDLVLQGLSLLVKNNR